MAEIKEFVIPDFLKNHSAREIVERILANIPDKMDKTEGGVLWDLTYSPSLVMAEVIEYVLVELLRNMFPMWAEGVMLNEHGRVRSIPRKSAQRATGVVTFDGVDGAEIPAGTKVATTATSADDSVVLYRTVESAVISGNAANVRIEAVYAGLEGNVAAGRVDRLDVPTSGIVGVINAEAITGGLDEENDDDYRQRQIDYDEAQDVSYGGTLSDYKRWAMSVNGVGSAVVTDSDDGSGVVTIIITDSDGKGATEKLCQNVYDYIMSPNNRENRLAPINAVLSVISPSVVHVNVSAKLVLSGSVTLDGVKDSFTKALNAYYQEAAGDGKVRYNRVSSILTNIAGVEDFSDLTVDGGSVNVIINSDQLPVTELGDVSLVEVEDE